MSNSCIRLHYVCGSTPFGNDYDRQIVIINTLRVNSIQLINNGNQILALAGSSLYDLENKLKPLEKEPHSVIGSTSIGASIVGGVCNNSGGSLVHRGPAYTEFALYAKVNKDGKLELINELATMALRLMKSVGRMEISDSPYKTPAASLRRNHCSPIESLGLSGQRRDPIDSWNVATSDVVESAALFTGL